MVETIYNTISREDAKTKNLSRYFSGIPCKRGHIHERYTSTGHCVRCAYETAHESRVRNPGKFKTWYHSNIKNLRGQMLSGARLRAKKRNIPFSITVDDITIPETCPVFGIPLVSGTNGWLIDSSPTLDRIEGEKGYVKGNIIVVSWKANKMKNDARIEDLKTLVEFYSKL